MKKTFFGTVSIFLCACLTFSTAFAQNVPADEQITVSEESAYFEEFEPEDSIGNGSDGIAPEGEADPADSMDGRIAEDDISSKEKDPNGPFAVGGSEEDTLIPEDTQDDFTQDPDGEAAVSMEPADVKDSSAGSEKGTKDPLNDDPKEKGEILLSSVEIPYETLIYNGKARTQSSISKVKGKSGDEEVILKWKKDFTVAYENNTDVGTATMTVTGIGNCTGTIVKTFKILPQKTELTSLTRGTKCFSAKWDEQTLQTNGYQLQYCRLESFASGKKSVYIKKNTITSCGITGLLSGKTYYVRIRTYKTVDGVRYFSEWSGIKSVSLTLNEISITGSGTTRTVRLYNPGASVTAPKLKVWSRTNGDDDLKTYSMAKKDSGTYKAVISAKYLKNYGTCYVNAVSDDKVLSEKSFSMAKADFLKTRNLITVSASGSSRTIKLTNPYGVKNPRAAVWTEERDQDDIRWYTMKKNSAGVWYAVVHNASLRDGGTVNVHIYSNNDKDYIGRTTYEYTLSDEDIKWNSAWELAGYSQIHTGTAKLYRASKKRKGIVIGINAGHGTVNGSSYFVYSHPDKTPKTTGGSTPQGAIYTPADNSGMTFADGTPEAQVTLDQSFTLKDVLLAAGYDVILIRENHDSGLDVIARTVICNELADCHIALHWDGDGLSYDKGIFYMSVPDSLKNMYPTSTVWQRSNRLGDCIIQGVRKKNLPVFESGAMPVDLMQTSYSKVPSIDIELGNQSSTHTASDLKKRANAILAGLNIFFK